MNARPARTRVTAPGVVQVAVTALTGTALAVTAIRYGIPVWLLPLGAVPPATFAVQAWLVNLHSDNYAARSRTAVEDRFYVDNPELDDRPVCADRKKANR